MCHRAVLALLLSGWLAAPAWAATTQSIIAGQTDPSDTTGTNYAPLLGSSVIALSGTEAHFQQMVSTGGTLSALRVELDADPGGTASYTIRVRIDGSNGNLTCAVNAGSTTCTDLSNSDAVSAGQRVNISITAANTPAASRVRHSLLFTPTTTNQTLLLVASQTYQVGDALPVTGGNGTGYATNARAESIMPVAGTIKNLYVGLDALGALETAIITLVQNGSTTLLTCTVTAPATTCNNTLTSVSVSADDNLRLVQSGTNSAAFVFSLGLTFEPTTTGDQVITAGDNTAMSSGSTQYIGPGSVDTVLQTTEAIAQQLTQAITLTAMSVELDGAPGGGNDYTFTIMVEGSANTDLQCTIAESATTCSDTGSVAVSAGQTITWRQVPTSTPTTRRLKIGLAGNIAETGAAARRSWLLN